MVQQLEKLKSDVYELILGSIIEGENLLEELLIQLLGHENSYIRSSAILYLNCIYDGNLWRLGLP